MSDETKAPIQDEMRGLIDLAFVTIYASILDTLLTAAIVWLTNLDAKHGLIIMDRMASPRKLNIIQTIIESDRPELLDSFNASKTAITAAISARNNLIHGHWIAARPGDFQSLLTIRTAGKLSAKSIGITPDDLKAATTQIKDAIDKLLEFSLDHGLSPKRLSS